jgi:iron complex transport system substrate-binding protein
VEKLPKLGGLEDAQIERIVALKPDVVLAGPSARVIDRLEQLGLKVLVIQSNSHADVRRGLETLARLLGTPDKADAVWAAIERDIRESAARVPASLRGQRAYFEVDDSAYAAGASSFIGETLALLGIGNIVTAELGPFPKLNPEFIVRAQPDLVLAAKRNFDGMAHRPGWASIKAVQAHRGCGFDAERYELLVRPGPRLGEAARVLADCLVGLDKTSGKAR